MSTSLVFLVVLGIWAAYLVQQWMRRREHLGTAKSVDAFTEALRVLDTRPPAAGSTPGRLRSHPASPLRTQPGVVVKHAGTSGARPRTAPKRSTTDTRLRALSLAGAGLLLAAAIVAAALGHVGWYLPVLALAVLGADVAYLHWSEKVRKQTVTGRTPVRVPVRTAPAEPVATAPASEAPRDSVRRVDEPQAQPATEPAQAPVVEEPEAPARSSQPFDIRAFDEPAAAPVVEEPLAPGTWRPTPVPAPLYTRKPQAQAPAAPVPSSVVPESDTVLSPVDLDDDLFDVESPFGKVVNG